MRKLEDCYEYGDDSDRITITKVVDGDTVDVDLHIATDIGFGVTSTAATQIRLRLAHINAPETNRKAQRTAGLAAKQWLNDHLTTHPVVKLRTYKTDSFHRYIADIWTTWPGTSVNELLVAAGHAVHKEY